MREEAGDHLEPPEAAVGDFEVGAQAGGRAVVAEAHALPECICEAQAQQRGVPCLRLQLRLHPPQPRPLRSRARLEPVLLRLRVFGTFNTSESAAALDEYSPSKIVAPVISKASLSVKMGAVFPAGGVADFLPHATGHHDRDFEVGRMEFHWPC